MEGRITSKSNTHCGMRASFPWHRSTINFSFYSGFIGNVSFFYVMLVVEEGSSNFPPDPSWKLSVVLISSCDIKYLELYHPTNQRRRFFSELTSIKCTVSFWCLKKIQELDNGSLIDPTETHNATGLSQLAQPCISKITSFFNAIFVPFHFFACIMHCYEYQ